MKKSLSAPATIALQGQATPADASGAPAAKHEVLTEQEKEFKNEQD